MNGFLRANERVVSRAGGRCASKGTARARVQANARKRNIERGSAGQGSETGGRRASGRTGSATNPFGAYVFCKKKRRVRLNQSGNEEHAAVRTRITILGACLTAAQCYSSGTSRSPSDFHRKQEKFEK